MHSSTEQLNDEAEYWRQEIALEKVVQAEAQNRDWEASAASDGSAEALKEVITAKKLLLEDAKQEQQNL